jgi:tRNA dimethylallyltransferase
MVDGIVITGPTAVGKTALSIDVAQQLAGEIISFDSRQVYRGMDIGTAKPSAAERAAVAHFGLDLLPPSERYNAGRFATDARNWIAEIQARGHVPILVGGTGFFLRALTRPMFAEPATDAQRKEAVKRYLERFSREELLRWLEHLDVETAQRMSHEGGRQRLARAIEVALLTGCTLSQWHREHPGDRPLLFRTFVLELPRAELYDRINRRVDQMIAEGLVDEVRGLLEAGYDESTPGMNTTGYIELVPYLRGEITLDDAIDAIKRTTRGYARRQHTWFRHQLPADAVTLDATQPLPDLTEAIVNSVASLNSVKSP